MPQPVYIHIGAPKTGTTFLQDVLWRNRVALKRNGLLYPGKGPGAHIMAALNLRDISFKGYRNPEAQNAWRRLVKEIERWGGPAIIDHELLAGARARQAERALRSLSFADVHIVITVRDMARQLPAAWQEWIRNRETETFAEWLTAVHNPVDEPGDPGRLFWRLHDVPTVLGRWTQSVAPDHVHVVTVPPPGSDPLLLWQRFASVIGVDPDAYDLSQGKPRISLAAPEVEVLRQLNLELGADRFPWKPYDRIVKRYLAFELARRDGVPIMMRQEEWDWAVQLSRDTVTYLAESGFRVVGDLAELIPTEQRPGIDPEAVPAAARADAAVAGLAALVLRLDEQQRKTAATAAKAAAAKPGRQPNRDRARAEAAERELQTHRELTPRERITKCAVELSDQVGWIGTGRKVYSRLRRR